MITSEQLPPAVREFLFCCAISTWFDVPLLEALWDEQNVTQALADLRQRGIITAGEDISHRFTVHASLREELLTELRDHHMLRYEQLQLRAFSHFAQRINTVEPGERAHFEEALMCHLRELFTLLITANKIPMLEEVLHQVGVENLVEPAHRHNYLYYAGCLHSEQHRYHDATHCFLAILEQPEADGMIRARTWTALGFNYEYQSLFDKAIAAHKLSREQYEQRGDREGISKTLNNEAIIYHQLADYEKAMPLLEESYRLAEAGGDQLMQGRALLHLGCTAKDLGQWDAALNYLLRCLRLWQKFSVHEMQARVHNNLGEVHQLLGDSEQAAFHFEHALEIVLDPQHENKREAVDMLLNLGFLRQTEGDVNRAQRHYLHAQQLALQIEHSSALSQISYRLGTLASNPITAKQAYQTAIEQIESMRGRIEEEETKIGLLATRQYVYQAMVLCCLALGEVNQAFAYIERARSRTFLDMMSQSQIAKATLTDDIVTVEQLQMQLAANAVLVEFYVTGAVSLNVTLLDQLPLKSQFLRQYLAPPDRVLAFIVNKHGANVIELNVDIRRLESQFFQRENGRLLGVTPLPGQPLHPLRRWRTLAEQLLTPLVGHLMGKQHLYLVPHYILHYLPLHALMDDLPVETVSYAPSASVLYKLLVSKKSVPEATQLLAIGVNTDGLTHAEEEARWIAHHFHGEALTGNAATIDTAQRHLGQYSVLHFACHSHFQRNFPLNSGLVLADGELTAADILRSIQLKAKQVFLAACDTGLNKVMRGDELFGLTRAFLGAGAESLVVTLWPIHEIPTRLFVEEFYHASSVGMTRAAALKGAQIYLRTLEIDDLALKLTMYGLTDEANEKLLQLFTKMISGPHPFNHPYYWAPFVLVGDPRESTIQIDAQ